jgi:hypothetical protein
LGAFKEVAIIELLFATVVAFAHWSVGLVHPFYIRVRGGVNFDGNYALL